MIIMIAIAYYDEILPPRSKQGFLLTFALIILVSACEWINVYLENTGPGLRYLNIVATYIMLLITPLIPSFLAWSMTSFERTKIAKILLIYNVFIQTANLLYGFMYTIDANNRYFRGELYWIDLPVIFYCVCVLFSRTYKLAKRYQTKNTYVLFCISTLLAIGTIYQVTHGRILVVWLSASISSMLIYTYYTSVVNEVDALTDLLNRSCYESKLSKMKKQGAILFFDVNKFKSVNDKYGHTFGDVCLKEIASTIQEVYKPYGLCYRIGGDEFCVVLKKSDLDIEKLNNVFREKIKEKRQEEERLPKVAVGYCVVTGDININQALKEADKMMYACKKDDKEQDKKEEQDKKIEQDKLEENENLTM